MSKNTFDECDVVIAGAGVGAAAAAMGLLSVGFRPLLLSRGTPPNEGAEALPERAVRLFDALGMAGVLPDAGAVLAEEFSTTWGSESGISRRAGRTHVERAALARHALAEAVRWGAAVWDCAHLPRLHDRHDWVEMNLAGKTRRFFAAVDATGRSASWSRPVVRAGGRVADIFRLAGPCGVPRAEVVTVDQGWAYRIDLADSITVGVVSRGGRPDGRIDRQVATKLKLAGEARFVGRRAAFPQWAEHPLVGRRLSIADAAVAHDPVSGQGITFALGSALAAAAVIRTWRDVRQNKELADSYYRELVAAERERHLSAVETLYGKLERGGAHQRERAAPVAPPASDLTLTALAAQSSPNAVPLPRAIRFAARTRVSAVRRDGLIVPDEVIALENGKAVRWLGNFDLLLLRNLCPTWTPLGSLLETLSQQYCTRSHGLALISWCLNNNILSSDE